MAEYLDLADYLLIAEAVLGVPAELIARRPGIGRAASALHAPAAGFEGVEFYPDVIDKAAVLCSHTAWRLSKLERRRDHLGIRAQRSRLAIA